MSWAFLLRDYIKENLLPDSEVFWPVVAMPTSSPCLSAWLPKCHSDFGILLRMCWFIYAAGCLSYKCQLESKNVL